MARHIIFAVCIFTFGIALSSFAYFGATKMQNMMAKIEPAAGDAAPEAVFTIGGSFELTGENGEAVTDAQFNDNYKLIFFGFTHCPDVCPAGMQKMSMAMDKLGDEAKRITPFFVTIDPRRDTPEVLREYTDMYDERIIGLTGSEEQLQDMEEKFKVYASKMASEEGEEFYMYAHSSYIYLTDKNNHLLTVFGHDDIPSDIAKEIKQAIQDDQKTL
jgi:protein SCO1/2